MQIVFSLELSYLLVPDLFPKISTRLLTGLLELSGSIIGLQAYLFHTMPTDEGGVTCGLVDHLGAGFYIWEMSFIILALSQLSVKRRRTFGLKD
jgi:hypothetical protein